MMYATQNKTEPKCTVHVIEIVICSSVIYSHFVKLDVNRRSHLHNINVVYFEEKIHLEQLASHIFVILCASNSFHTIHLSELRTLTFPTLLTMNSNFKTTQIEKSK